MNSLSVSLPRAWSLSAGRFVFAAHCWQRAHVLRKPALAPIRPLTGLSHPQPCAGRMAR
jgi:hypothetical protein